MTVAPPEKPSGHPPSTRSYRLTAPNAIDTPRLARDHVAQLLNHTGYGQLADTARLLLSEAATNVFQHTTVHLLTVETTIRDDRVLVAIRDTSPRLFVPLHALHPGTEDESGRGLVLLGLLAAAWGITWHGTPQPEAKTVWFELSAATAGSP